MGEKLVDKVELYNILGILVPGILLIAWLPLCFLGLLAVTVPKFPDAFSASVLIALAFFAGYIIQALGSLMEPFLCWLWRGKHSSRVFQEMRNPCFAPVSALRIREKIAARPGMGSCDDGALYQVASSLAESAPASRVARFNALYAFHRALLVLVLLVAVTLPISGTHGLLRGWSTKEISVALFLTACLIALIFNRTRVRSVYYVREIALTAERQIDAAPATPQAAAQPEVSKPLSSVPVAEQESPPVAATSEELTHS